MPKISLNNVSKRYPGAKEDTVKNFNLDIQDQEFIVFVGPSGCGKSTTLRMIAGLEEITSGELVINGEVMNDVAPKDRDIAMVFQNYALYPHMTVEENMSFGLKIRKVDEADIKKRVKDAAEVLGLSDHLDSRPGELSGGQRQRVALGRAIVRNAQIFLMDEPLSNLDAKLRVKMRAEISRLHESLKTTTIYVTHDQTEAMTLASRIVILDDGIIQQVGSPYEVYNRPANMFVASFIGSPSMNFIDVHYQNGRITTPNGIDIPVAVPHQKALDNSGWNDKQIVFGIRPEHIHSENIALEAYPEARIEAEISMAELTGNESILFLDFKGTDFVARVNARDHHQSGKKIDLAFDMNKAQFFNPETQETLL